MTYSWNQVTNELMTNLYLYGQQTKPENLVDDQLIRPADDPAALTDNVKIAIDAVGYMESGPGRFAFAALSPLVEAFLKDFPTIITDFTLATRTASGGYAFKAVRRTNQRAVRRIEIQFHSSYKSPSQLLQPLMSHNRYRGNVTYLFS